MKNKKLFSILIVLILLMSLTGTAFAQEEGGDVAACEGESVVGTVTAVDEETGTITVLQEDGTECTVETTSSYDHPITDLLGYYFSEANPDALAGALESTTVCATVDEDGNYVVVAAEEEAPAEGEEVGEGEETEGEGEEEEVVCEGTELTVTGEGEEGGFTATDADGNEVSLTVEDEDAAGDLVSALNDLEADWALTEDGAVDDVGDDIAEYHDDGTGFGVLVKLYSIAAESLESCQTADVDGEGEDLDAEPAVEDPDAEPVDECGVTVEELIAMMEEGESLGDLFETYGRPTMMGIGHVKQALSDSDGGDGDGDGNGVCHARSVGGNAYAGGKTCP